jgi:pilus assembly protein CpaB
MPVLVPKGKRAVSIIVDQAVQRSGFVVPNSRVDVLVTMAGGSGGDRKSRIVLQDVTILAADQTVEMKDNKPVTMTTVTMALSPEETERLTLAQSEGKVALALRNVQDTAQISTPGITAAQLMGGATPPSSTAKKATPAAPSVAKRAPGPARTAAPMAQPAPAAQAPVSVPPPPTHTVSIIRGTAVSEQTYMQDSGGGWTEGTKADATKKAR